MARGYRMDTPKGAVQFAFDQHGEAAARVKAVDLGVEKKLNRWIEQWKGKEDLPPKGGGVIEGRRRVRELGHPKERKGTVVKEGAQVSMVRWDNGDVRYVSNSNLITQVRKGSA
jgi:hypothetical protein